jgi:hypothetical protein
MLSSHTNVVYLKRPKRPKHFGFPLDLHPSESEIVDAVFQPEKPIRGEPVESCKLRYFNSSEFFDHTRPLSAAQAAGTHCALSASGVGTTTQGVSCELGMLALWLGSERCGETLQRRPIRLIRNTRNAAPLRMLRTACSRPQCRNSRAASSDCKSSFWLSNRLLVGRMTMRVKGVTSRRSSPPTSQARPPSNHHDARAEREPIRASGTCISVPRL